MKKKNSDRLRTNGYDTRSWMLQERLDDSSSETFARQQY
jgi:hypothetical protein